MANNPDLPLILASQSPRRKQLFEQAGYLFRTHPADESVESNEANAELSAKELVSSLSLAKARWVAGNYETGIVIGADTVAECGGRILGKPVDLADAERMIRTLMNTVHQVLTGVTLWNCATDQRHTHVESTTLRMDLLSDSTINAYLQSDGWRGKAGAFGYQDGLDWIHIIEGLESTVVGFPIEKLDDWIEQLLISK